jgi:hypothetical protein
MNSVKGRVGRPPGSGKKKSGRRGGRMTAEQRSQAKADALARETGRPVIRLAAAPDEETLTNVDKQPRTAWAREEISEPPGFRLHGWLTPEARDVALKVNKHWQILSGKGARELASPSFGKKLPEIISHNEAAPDTVQMKAWEPTPGELKAVGNEAGATLFKLLGGAKFVKETQDRVVTEIMAEFRKNQTPVASGQTSNLPIAQPSAPPPNQPAAPNLQRDTTGH